MPSLPSPNLDNCWRYFSEHASASHKVVSRDLSYDSEQEWNFCIRVVTSAGISYNSSWRLKHKLMQAMLEHDSETKLIGRVEIDDAYIGAKRVVGKCGRGADRKTSFVAAVETDCEKRPLRVKLSKVKGFRKEEIERWGNHHLESKAYVVPDGLSCFTGIQKAGFHHEPHITGSGKAAEEHPSFKWVNTILGNVKNSLISERDVSCNSS